jgi:phospholipid N-methyltransferase
MSTETFDIDSMPRGGPNASWLDRRLQTDRLEYIDRDDVDHLKSKVLRTLERGGRIFGQNDMLARLALDEVAGVAQPKILELGAGHGGLSRALLKLHPTAEVTVTDVEPTWVDAIAASDLGSHPRVTVREMDATAIDASDGYYDLIVFALAFHHLPPRSAARVVAEGTRAANKLLIIDLPRRRPALQVVWLGCYLPLAAVIPSVHDGIISTMRAYSPSAMRALARHADPAIRVELRRTPLSLRGRLQVVLAYR